MLFLLSYTCTNCLTHNIRLVLGVYLRAASAKMLTCRLPCGIGTLASQKWYQPIKKMHSSQYILFAIEQCVLLLQLASTFGTYADFEIYSSIEIALERANQRICINA